MAELQTQGFALSALPRSPDIPANVGVLDVKGIYDGVRQGLAAFENVRRAPVSMALADTTAAAQTAQGQADLTTLPVRTAGVLADTPQHSAILATQNQATADALSERRKNRAETDVMKAQFAAELPIITDKLSKANSILGDDGKPDYNAQAAALSQIEAEHPAIGALVKEPVGGTASLAKSIETARNRAQIQSATIEQAKLREQGMKDRATILAAPRMAAATTLRGVAGQFQQHAQYLDQEAALQGLIAQNQDDEEAKASLALVQQKIAESKLGLNLVQSTVPKNQIPAKSPEGLAGGALTKAQNAEKEANQAQMVYDTAVANNASPEEISFAASELQLARDNAVKRAKLADDLEKSINNAKIRQRTGGLSSLMSTNVPVVAAPGMTPPAVDMGSAPRLTVDQVKKAGPGKFIGAETGQSYEKLPDGTIRKL